MRFLLDTNTVINVLNHPADGLVARRLRLMDIDEIATSTLVISELMSGAYRGAQTKLADNLLRIRSLRFSILEFNRADAEIAGEIDAALKRAGTPIGPIDRLIAGQGLARGLTVVTNNLREFARVDGLQVADWSLPVS